MEKLTIQEEEVMIYIWELQSCFVKDIVAKYPQPAPPYTTVASIVKNLERKGYVTSKRVGNTYQYTPATVSYTHLDVYKRQPLLRVKRAIIQSAESNTISTNNICTKAPLVRNRKNCRR